MRLLAASALALVGCGLVAPFDLGALPPGRPDGGDGGGDADADGPLGDGDVDGLRDADGAADGDAEDWDPLESCDGAVSDERWALAAAVGGELHGYLSSRDCAVPLELCVDCFPSAISPSGRRVLVVTPQRDRTWRLEDEISLVDLSAGTPTSVALGVRGASPAWLDDDRFVFYAAPVGVLACTGEGTPELTDLVVYDLRTRTGEPVGRPVHRAWRVGVPVPSVGRSLVAFGHDLAPRCNIFEFATSIRDLETGEDDLVPWTETSVEYELPIGGLPDDGGAIIQRFEFPIRGQSTLYAVPWGGDSRPLVRGVPAGLADFLLPDFLVMGYWPSCGSVRRMGPGCEIYCLDAWGPGWWRVPLAGGEAEAVSCEGPWDEVRIMDVWQRRAGAGRPDQRAQRPAYIGRSR